MRGRHDGRTLSRAIALVTAVAGAAALAERRLRNWGGTVQERRRTWPGDELVAEPASSTAKGIDIEAPADVVWQWLVQIGQDRGGWYSYEWLENLFGLRIRNTDRIREEWQHLSPGDVVRMVPRGWLHLLRDGFGLPVAQVDPPRTLVLREDPDDMPWDAVWTFALEPRGEHRCRLVSHTLEHRASGAGASLGRAASTPFQLLTHLMTRRMLLGLRDRAESRSARRRWDPLLHRTFLRDVRVAKLVVRPGEDRIVTEDDLAHLDEPVARYLRFMGVVGHPRTRSFTVDFDGRFRLRPGGPWMPASARQQNTVEPLGRVFTMVLRFAGVVPMVGHDTYLGGTGQMVGKLAGLVTVADGRGREFDIGELSTWLNDAALLAPSMLLAAPVTMSAVDDRTIELTLHDSGMSVSARLQIDAEGAPVDYWTRDRWAALPGGPVRATWRTPIRGWDRTGEGPPFPRLEGATWELEDGPFTYIEGGFVPGSLRYDVVPSASTPRAVSSARS